MAAASTATQVFQNHNSGNNNNNNGVNRQEIQAAIAKAVELRALHAALMQGNSPAANNRFNSSSTSPVSRPVSQFSAHDYPVFTPVSFVFFFLVFKTSCNIFQLPLCYLLKWIFFFFFCVVATPFVV